MISCCKLFLRAMLIGSIAVLGVACTSATNQAMDVANASAGDSRVTVGTVQREIRVGMSGAEVAAALGSPNVVTTDQQRHETWVYDRIATEHAYSSSSGGVNALFLAAVGGNTGVSRTSQRTLTIIIYFDGNGLVRDFAYRSSSF